MLELLENLVLLALFLMIQYPPIAFARSANEQGTEDEKHEKHENHEEDEKDKPRNRENRDKLDTSDKSDNDSETWIGPDDLRHIWENSHDDDDEDLDDSLDDSSVTALIITGLIDETTLSSSKQSKHEEPPLSLIKIKSRKMFHLSSLSKRRLDSSNIPSLRRSLQK